MMAERERLTVTYDEEFGERFETAREREDVEHQSDLARDLMRRGLDEWEAEQASYPGSDFIEGAIELSAVGFIVGLVATIITRGSISIGAAMAMAFMVVAALTAHYAAMEMQRRGEV